VIQLFTEIAVVVGYIFIKLVCLCQDIINI